MRVLLGHGRQKRGLDRTPDTATPLAKKRKLSTSVQITPALLSTPSVSTPTGERRAPKLPWKIADNKPLPTLPGPQPTALSDNEYQSIAASAVLQASLSRSQARWTRDGLFERYWTKPETGKNARPPPPNNPDLKWMKFKGECRIRIEPHIFECQMYVEERPRHPPPHKQPAPLSQAQAAYGQPYRPSQAPLQHYAPAQQQGQPYHGQTLPPIRQPMHQHPNMLPPINNMTQRAPSAAPPPAKKANPDPVITKLAGRASSDPELKRLMKEVATGSATPDQLKIFQRHIDELQTQIKSEKEEREREDEEQERRREMDTAAHAQASEEVIQYDGAGDSRTSTPTPVMYHMPQTAAPYQPPKQPYVVSQQPTWTPSTTNHAVILSFSTPGASEDRFLFPQYSIVERLSGNHHLASFIVMRKGRDAADPTGLDPNKEYWQPVTMMLEVKLGLEDLPDYVKRWVKPADEARRHMEGIMKRCERAPESFVAMRLPLKGSVDPESSTVSKEATPLSVHDERPAKPKSSVKYVKKATSSVAKSTPAAIPTAESKKHGGATKPANGVAKSALATPVAQATQVAASDGAGDEPSTTESGRPKRAVRKSVRISEG
ncbi:hypothetical protein B0A55_06902 [Friedmanniomyces simplex]|uniref:SWR1-complex protein 3 domain-containing protein n=1 Tax=Friedmanniomyces simplex TaxID=329884 RepID=A0A4U0X5Y2_9PEZI|nr:hypothetical protein B0A55_06902 [Friedmanniomyces simplex]